MNIEAGKLQELKETLLSEKKRIQGNIEVLKKDLDFGDSPGMDNEEADESEEAANELNTIDALEGRVVSIDAALARMEAGTYGVCEDCGEDIDLELLEVNPESTVCRNCKD